MILRNIIYGATTTGLTTLVDEGYLVRSCLTRHRLYVKSEPNSEKELCTLRVLVERSKMTSCPVTIYDV